MIDIIYPIIYFGIGAVMAVAFFVFCKLRGTFDSTASDLCFFITLFWIFLVTGMLAELVIKFLVKVVFKKRKA